MKNSMRPVHPGEILREEYLRPLGMSANALALALRVPAPRIKEIVRERRGITPDTALRLARYFGGDARSWLNLQSAFDLRTVEVASREAIEREGRPARFGRSLGNRTARPWRFFVTLLSERLCYPQSAPGGWTPSSYGDES